MIPRFVNAWHDVRSSLWALPFLMVLGSIALAYFAIQTKIGQGSDPVWFLYSGDAAAAPQFLSNLLTSMITMATLAISITMVVLTLAAQQLGPRLIRSFMGDRRTQLALGLFIATVVYLLLVLRATSGATDSIPNLAVTGGTVLVLISVVTLVLFVHHLAYSIIADNVIDRVGARLDADVIRMMPTEAPEQPEEPTLKQQGAPVHLSHGGYVQAIDYDGIVAAACAADARVEFAIRPGQHALPGRVFAYITPKKAAENEGLCQAVEGATVIGRVRTSVQDIEFSVRQLVEIALRALSPGINDPDTANAVVDRMTLSLGLIMTRSPAKSVWQDGDGKTRLVTPVSTFEGICDAAFNQIRQQALTAVLIRMADNIGQLLEQAEDMHRPALEKHLKLVLDAGKRGIPAEEDLKDLEARAAEALTQAGSGETKRENR